MPAGRGGDAGLRWVQPRALEPFQAEGGSWLNERGVSVLASTPLSAAEPRLCFAAALLESEASVSRETWSFLHAGNHCLFTWLCASLGEGAGRLIQPSPLFAAK